MHGLVTVLADNNLTEVSQGIFRLRNINISHTVDFLVSPVHDTDSISIDENDSIKLPGMTLKHANTVMELSRDSIDLIKNLEKNAEDFIENTKPIIALQCIKSCYRQSLNYLSDSFLEHIFYDLIPSKKTKEIFDREIVDLMLKEMKLTLKDVNILKTKLFQIHLNTNLNTNINININLSHLSLEKTRRREKEITIVYDKDCYNMEDIIVGQFKDSHYILTRREKIDSYEDAQVYDVFINIFDIFNIKDVKVSPAITYPVRDHQRIYLVYNKDRNIKIIILEYEIAFFLKFCEHKPENKIAIYDRKGNIVFTNISEKLPNILELVTLTFLIFVMRYPSAPVEVIISLLFKYKENLEAMTEISNFYNGIKLNLFEKLSVEKIDIADLEMRRDTILKSIIPRSINDITWFKVLGIDIDNLDDEDKEPELLD